MTQLGVDRPFTGKEKKPFNTLTSTLTIGYVFQALFYRKVLPKNYGETPLYLATLSMGYLQQNRMES